MSLLTGPRSAFRKPLVCNLLILLSYCILAGCPVAQPGATGAGGGRALIGPGPEAGGAGDTGSGGDVGAGGSAGEGGGGGEGGGAGGTVPATPITVTGSPLGIMPKPDCAPAGTRVYFDDVKTAITGQKDELNRDIIQVKGSVFVEWGGGPAEGLGQEYVHFSAPPAEADIGMTALWKGCFFAAIHAPEGAAGRVIRLESGLFGCVHEFHPEAGPKVLMKKGGLSGSTWISAVYDLTLPARTEETSLAPCASAPTHAQPVFDLETILQREIERRNEQNEGGEQNPFKSNIMQRR